MMNVRIDITTIPTIQPVFFGVFSFMGSFLTHMIRVQLGKILANRVLDHNTDGALKEFASLFGI